MSKLVVLKLDGTLEEGFRATLSVGRDGQRPQIEVRGNLPPSEELIATLLEHWETNYRTAGTLNRIKPKRIHYNNRRHPSTLINECRRSADQLKDRFNRWMRWEEFRDIDIRLREELNLNEPIRLLIATQDTKLQKLPWHLWDFVRHYPLAEVALSPLNYRQTSFSCRSHTSEKVKILAILGHAKDIDVEKDRKLLESLPNAETVFLVEPERAEISDRLWNQPWDIIFFAGHSETEGEVGKIYLNQTDSLTVDELWYALRKAVDNGLQLAIFNSCDGLGLTYQLDDLQIPQTIVMRELVPDLVAQEFLKHFLASFSKGQSFYLAVREARERLQSLEGKYPCASWLPVICQNPAVLPPTWEDLLNSAVNYNFQSEGVKKSSDRQKTSILKLNKKRKIAALILLGLCAPIWHFGTPKLAVVVNNWGFARYQEEDFTRARFAWNFVALLNPNNAASPYNLGWVCEKLQDFDCAKKQYLKAAQLDLDAGYSQLGRLYIKENNYPPAVNLLFEGLKRAEDDRITYSLQKNIGWARLGQGRYEEAKYHLEKAIKLDSDRAPARCLLAQVYEGMGDNRSALEQWQICLDNAKPENADEDIWIGMARERLQVLSQKQEIEGEKQKAREEM